MIKPLVQVTGTLPKGLGATSVPVGVKALAASAALVGILLFAIKKA